MASTTDDKNHLIREMRLARERFDFNSASLRRDLDIPARTRRSVQKRMPIWLTAAMAVGWIMSRLPSRKRQEKIYVDRNEIEVKRVVKSGFLLGLLKVIFTMLKPAILAYATKRISDLAQSQKNVERKVEKVDRQVEKVDRQVEKVDRQVERVDRKTP